MLAARAGPGRGTCAARKSGGRPSSPTAACQALPPPILHSARPPALASARGTRCATWRGLRGEQPVTAVDQAVPEAERPHAVAFRRRR
jgi:hypothetical protein